MFSFGLLDQRGPSRAVDVHKTGQVQISVARRAKNLSAPPATLSPLFFCGPSAHHTPYCEIVLTRPR